MRTEDGYIINKCLNGDSAAFGLLVDKYKESIYALAYSKLGNFHDAEDVAQEVFIKAYENLRTLKRWDSFLAWLYSITSNLCKMLIRARSRRPDYEFIEDKGPKMLETSSMNSYRENRLSESLHEALDSLPEMHRQVLTLFYLGGMSGKEIARFLGMSPNTIRQRLYRARSLLKEEMLAMMSTTYEGQRLKGGFTLRIVETVKRMKIQPMPRTTALPWGLSFAAGIIVAVLSLSPYLNILNPMSMPAGSPLPVETKVMKTGEIPVDILKASEIPVMASKQGNGNGGKPAPPDPQNAALMAPHGQGDTWAAKADMPAARNRLSTCVVDGIIYAIGGTDKGNLSTVEAYDPAKNAWVKKADMPTARHWLSASVVDGIIYAIGGRLDVAPWRTMATVEAYNPVEDKWITKTDMPTHRATMTTSVVDGIIYAIGGFQGGSGPGLTTVEAYDPAKEKWETKADMPVGRRFHTASVVDGKIYVIGGGAEAADWEDPCCEIVAVYDPASDTWEERNGIMPSPRADLSSSVVNGIIYAFGGTSFPPGNQEGLSTVEAYDTATDTWEVKADMPTARTELSTIAVDGKIYAIGGATRYLGIALPTVEAYDTGFAPSNVRPTGKLVRPWGAIKSD
jgi:RNA polymerase sigma factor (sigma-70 family)